MDDKKKWLLPLRIIILASSDDLVAGDFDFKIENIFSISKSELDDSFAVDDIYKDDSGCTDMDIGETFLTVNSFDFFYESSSVISSDNQKHANLKNLPRKPPVEAQSQKTDQIISKPKRRRRQRKPRINLSLAHPLKIYCPGCQDSVKLKNMLYENGCPQRCAKCREKIEFLCLWCEGIFRNYHSAQNHCSFNCKKQPPVKLVLTKNVSGGLEKLKVEEKKQDPNESCKLEKTIKTLNRRLGKRA